MQRSKFIAPVIALLTLLTACGPREPGLCEDTREGALTPWVNETWEPYCSAFSDHLLEPERYSIGELTKFFADHPAKREELKTSLSRYAEPERCFRDVPAERLRYQSLKDCLEANESMTRKIHAAWSARAEGWFKEYTYRVKKLRRDLDDIEVLGDKLNMKLEQKFDFRAPMDDDLFDRYAQSLSDVQPDVEFLNGAKPTFDSLIGTAKTDADLARMIKNTYGKTFENLISDHDKNRLRYAKLSGAAAFYKHAVYAVGKQCPDGQKANKEVRAAKEALALELSKFAFVTSPRVTKKTVRISDEAADIEKFEGIVCTARGDSNQFEDRRELCSQYHFIVERQRAKGERRWEDWTLQKFEEGDVEEGVDCNLIQGK